MSVYRQLCLQGDAECIPTLLYSRVVIVNEGHCTFRLPITVFCTCTSICTYMYTHASKEFSLYFHSCTYSVFIVNGCLMLKCVLLCVYSCMYLYSVVIPVVSRNVVIVLFCAAVGQKDFCHVYRSGKYCISTNCVLARYSQC